MIGRDQGVEVNHLPGRLVTPRHLHPRGPRTDRALRGRLLRKLLEQIRSRHRRLSTSNAIAGNQISVETATGKNSHPLTVTPSSASWIARWTMMLSGAAPCQCSRPGSIQTESPGLMTCSGPPRFWSRPAPETTYSVWPRGWVCHAFRAPGSKVTHAAPNPIVAAGCGTGIIQTVPVNRSAGPRFALMSVARATSIGLPPFSHVVRFRCCWIWAARGLFPAPVPGERADTDHDRRHPAARLLRP